MKTLLPILKTKLFLLGFVSACTVILATTVPQIRNFIAPEKAIGEKITTEQKKISPKNKNQNRTVSSSRVTSGLSLEMNNSFEATVTSDKDDYAPLSTAVFTGNGFGPNEQVILKVKNLNQPCNTVTADSSYFPWTVTTDELGHFETTWTVCNCPGDSLRLKATGQTSGSIAYAYFTDAIQTRILEASMSPNTGACGSTITVYATLEYKSGNPNTFSPLSGKTITFTLGANTVISAPTGSDGVASASIVVPGGAATLIADYAGDGAGANSYSGTNEDIAFTTTGTTTATLTSIDQTICPGENGLLSIALTGSGTISGTLTGGIPFSGIDGTVVTINVSPSSTTTYEILTVTNGTCNGTFSGDTKISVKGKATADAGDDETFCVDEIDLSGTVEGPGNSPASASWTSSGDGTFDNTQDATTGYNPGPNDIINGSVLLTLTASGPGLCDGVDNITITIDKTLPIISASGTPTTLGCNPSASDINAALGSASATDNCGTPTVTTSNSSISSDGCSRSQTRTFTATDNTNGTATTSRTVTWIADNTPPGFTGSYADESIGCNPGNPDGSLGTATATDACGIITNITSSDGFVISDGCNRSKTRTFTATDDCLNTSTTSRTVRWIEDITPPVLTTGGTTTSLGCNPVASDINGALGTATATDACGIPTVLTPSDGSVTSNGCTRTQKRTFTAIDGCGNTSTACRTVTWIEDITPPVLTTGGTTTSLGCNPVASDINGALGTATATDACGIPTVLTPSDGSVTSNGCTRTQKRTFTAIDGCGNTSTACRTVTWIEDITPPVLTTGGTTTSLGCNPVASDINGALGTATATDACGIPTVLTPSDGSVTSNGCTRTQKRTFTAIDGCGNTSTACRTVTWIEDITPPVLTTGGTTTSLGCNPVASDINGALGTATATDACGIPTVLTPSDGSVTSNGCTRTQKRTFTAIDGCGNTSTACRTVTWIEDITPPVLTTGGTTTSLGCNPVASDINGALGTATATDACGIPTVLTPSDGSVTSNGCTRTQKRTFTAIDGCGNTSTACRTVTWIEDITPPVLTTGGTTTSLGCNPVASDINGALGTATATDACGIPTVLTPSDGSVTSNGCTRTQKRTFTAIDGCGNTSTACRTVTWTVDNATPTLQTVNTSLWPPNHKMVDIGLTASDNCGITNAYVTVTSNEPKNDIGDGDTEVDIAFTGGEEDPDATTYTVKGPVTIGSDGKVHIQVRAERSGVNAVAPEEGRIYTITFVATDACNNSATSTSTVTVAHNITSPNVGNSFKVGSTVTLAGTFWDVPGNKHTAKWQIDGTSVNGTIVAEPNGNKMGKVSGSFKTSAAGVFKLRMNVTDQKGVTSYATTNGDYEAFLVVYDPNGGYTYGGGSFISPAGAVISNPNMTGKVAFGFASNYFKNAANPKGETELAFKVGSVEFNALNYDVLSVDPTKSKATYRGLGKTIIDGVEQSGYGFLMVVIDGKTLANPNGVDRIRIKIYNRNSGAIIYDNQPGASDNDDPTTPVFEPNTTGTDIVVENTPTNNTSADLTRSSQMEVVPTELGAFNVRAFPNPSEHVFSLVLENATNEKVQIVVYDAIGRQVKMFEKQNGNIPIRFGMDLKVGAYIVEVKQGDNRKTLKLVKQ